ncbi:hypothetical protein [Sanguibacter gelidistatuariae]|uniref:hypothetical protein n=1 Tax=Sanguibacter gelidistatuariae TaxID=1814289 RepID=UPI001588195E|nr:hypothetical protein [Sanguibacter gelidistatuariae]
MDDGGHVPAGPGTTISEMADGDASAQGAGKVQLMVRTANTAVADFYAALGYTDQESVVLGRRFE